MTMLKKLLLAALSGLALVFAFQPFGLGFLAWAGFVPLFIALEGAGMKRGFILGFASGFVFFLGTVYWVIHSMYYYGGVPFGIGILVMLGLVIYMSVYIALFGIAFSILQKLPGIARLVAVPSAWVALEYLRGHLFTGFPWVLAGYSQASYIPVIQIADTTGVWGISFAIILFNTALFLFARHLMEPDSHRPLKELVIGLALLTSIVGYGFMKINLADKASGELKSLKVAVAQGNIEQSLKWDEAFRLTTIDIYKGLSLKGATEGARLIIWPETAVPFFLGVSKDEDSLIEGIARDTKSYILTGSPYARLNSGTLEHFNSAYLLSPESGITGRYDKVHLVPFGEYVPFKKYLPFIKKLTAGVGDFSSGKGPYPLYFEGEAIGTLICFEAIFPDIARGFVQNGATLLVNMTNDAWFGLTSAPYQHFAISVFRAVENRVFLLRSANTGISAVIDPFGRVKKSSGLFEQTLIVDEVFFKKGKLTLYSRFGDSFAIGCIVIAGVSIITAIRRK